LNIAHRSAQSSWGGITTKGDILENGTGTFIENCAASDIGSITAEGHIGQHGVAMVAKYSTAAIGSVSTKGNIGEHWDAIFISGFIKDLIIHPATGTARSRIAAKGNIK
jgi:hypothetical protein